MTPRKRRLLTLGHSYVVGANRRLAHEMMAAAGDQWEILAAAPSFFDDKDLRPVRLELRPDEEGKVVALPAYFTRRAHAFLYGPKLGGLLRKNWDVVHAWEEPYIFVGGELALLAPRSTRLVFRTAQSLDKRYPPPFSLIERFAMSRATGWICSGGLVEANLKARNGYGHKPMRRIPLGVDRRKFFPDPAARAKTLAALGWEEQGPPVVGYLGRIHREKGIPLLMEALDRLRTPWRALFIGAGPMEKELRDWAARHPAQVRVCSDVQHDQVPGYLNAADLLVAPSQTMKNWKEQFGRMLVEAFATGLPVIGSDSGEIPYVIDGIGVVVPEKDVAGWAKAIEELLESPARRREMGQRGLDAAAERYAWPVVAKQYIDFFESLL